MRKTLNSVIKEVTWESEMRAAGTVGVSWVMYG